MSYKSDVRAKILAPLSAEAQEHLEAFNAKVQEQLGIEKKDVVESKQKTPWEEIAEKPKEQKDDGTHFPLSVFRDSIEKVEKVLSVSTLGRPVWKIHMRVGPQKQVIAIENKKLTLGPIDFNSAVFGAFGVFLPMELLKKAEKGTPSKWITFITALSQMAETVQPEDSTAWLETDILLETIAGFDVTENRDEWEDSSRGGNTLLRKEHKGVMFLCIKSKEVSALAKTLKLGASLENFSEVMDARDIKRASNPALALRGRRKTRAWWIREEELGEKEALPHGQGNEQSVPVDCGY